MSTKKEAEETERTMHYETLKKASIEHYRTGISLKEAAKKHKVGIRELKDFYENEAAEFLATGARSDDDDSGEDP